MKKISNLSLKTGRFFSLLSVAMLLSGCSSIGKGIAEAVLEKSETEDTRQCQVWGKPFAGLDAGLSKSHGKAKVLFVHGVGDHIPGYTTQFLEKLAKELNLNVRSEGQKNITLSAPLLPGKQLGNLRVTHLLNEETGKDLTFYELTWSEITRKEKQLLAFDNSGEYDFRRAKINSLLKKFSNDTGPDPIIYLGQNREAILASFGQSFCWMASGDYEDLPDNGTHVCKGLNDANIDHIEHDDYVFISHSLGSRITLDGMQRIVHLLANVGRYADPSKNVIVTDKAIAAIKTKHIPIYMLSNQLPMLQLGRELPEVVGQRADFCEVNGANYNKRMFNQTEIIAFSDPNDLLSYGIPRGFAEQYIDARLCTSVTNININIANVMDAFGFADLANPMQAHVGYDSDDRVVALIAKGIGHPEASPLVKQRCEFTKEVK